MAPNVKKPTRAKSKAARGSSRAAALVSSGALSLVNMVCVFMVGAGVFLCLLVASKLS